MPLNFKPSSRIEKKNAQKNSTDSCSPHLERLSASLGLRIQSISKTNSRQLQPRSWQRKTSLSRRHRKSLWRFRGDANRGKLDRKVRGLFWPRQRSPCRELLHDPGSRKRSDCSLSKSSLIIDRKWARVSHNWRIRGHAQLPLHEQEQQTLQNRFRGVWHLPQHPLQGQSSAVRASEIQNQTNWRYLPKVHQSSGEYSSLISKPLETPKQSFLRFPLQENREVDQAVPDQIRHEEESRQDGGIQQTPGQSEAADDAYQRHGFPVQRK